MRYTGNRMDTEENREKIIEQLELLNAKMERQASFRHVLVIGIIHGIGLFIGSVIIASIAFGVLSPWVGKIDWIKDNFERGSSLTE